MNKIILFAFLFTLTISSCLTTRNNNWKNSAGREPADVNRIQSNIEFLADDALEGREAGTRGELLASLFIVSELKKYGIQPYGDNGTYFQNFYLEKIQFDNSSSLFIVNSAGDTLHEFFHGEDFVGTTRFYNQFDTLTTFAFAGYGIKAEEYNHDDYDSLDVTGCIVLILPGEPESSDSTYFEGSKRSPYSSTRHKLSTARDAGAVGVIFLSWGEKRFGWDGVRDYEKKGDVQLHGAYVSAQLPNISIREETFKEIIELDEKNFDAVLTQKEGFRFNNSVAVRWGFSGSETILSRNVLGMIPGIDEELNAEIVAIGAHYDHVGISEAGVFNGADDNASGTAAILESARLLSIDTFNRRSILVAFYSAEEKGLLGSKYLTDSLSTINNVVGNVNLDMIGRGSADTIYSIGSAKISSEFHRLVEEANQNSAGFHFDYIFDELGDSQRLYYRSDHYNYARLGIPVVFFFDYQMGDYHKVTDDVENLNPLKIAKVADLTREIVLRVANHDHRLDERNFADY